MDQGRPYSGYAADDSLVHRTQFTFFVCVKFDSVQF